MKKLSSLCYQWIYASVWPGLGLFGESYLLFSVGTFQPLWRVLFPDCYNGSCSSRLLNSTTYSVVLGVICGMLVIGYLANTMGRRAGSITTAAFMAGGAALLTATTFLNDAALLFRCMSVFFFIFGFGVGGEYPLSASSASERAMQQDDSNEDDALYKDLSEKPSQQNRGQGVQLVFTMQGMGIFCNCLTMTILLVLTGQTSNEYNLDSLRMIWRLTYALGAAVLVFVLVSRIRFLEESKVWQQDQENMQQQKCILIEKGISKSSASISSSDSSVSSLSNPSVVQGDVLPHDDSDIHRRGFPLALFFKHFGMRLFGVSGAWLLWDVAFYGNKLFQSSFLLAITGEETTLFEFGIAATLNAGVALSGYFAAAVVMDYVGRRELQLYGFFVTALLFFACGFFYQNLSTLLLAILYILSSFFGQCGPNASTFGLPAELFPTRVRTSCHGVAAAAGKVGALIAATNFQQLSETQLFLVCAYASSLAFVLTMATVPDLRSLDLKEIDLKWQSLLSGIEYEGPANHIEYLSYVEWRQYSRSPEMTLEDAWG